MRIWITKHKPNKDPKFHKELILDGEGSSTKELLTIFNKGWTFKIEVIINWGQFGLQDANSPIIEELIFLHNFINLISIFFILFVRYSIISILLYNHINKSDKNSTRNSFSDKEKEVPFDDLNNPNPLPSKKKLEEISKKEKSQEISKKEKSQEISKKK